MYRKSLVVVLITCLCVAWTSAADDSLSEAKLAALKASTVLIQCTLPGGASSGSGFVIQRDGKTAWIVSNAHVVRPDDQTPLSTSVIFNSGGNEVILPATFVTTAGNADLALIKVDAEKLPAPLPLGSLTKVRETQGVFVLGFPFGDMLASSSKHPSMTVGKATISSLRRNDFGVISAIQVDGALNPGNSGGPVVNGSGEVIGVSVATVRGAGLGLIIPVDNLRHFMSGNPYRIEHEQVAGKKGEAKINFKLWFVDPFAKVSSLTLLVVPVEQVKEMPQASAQNNDMPRIASSVKDVQLQIDRVSNGPATGTMTISGPTSGARADYFVQAKISSGNNTRYSGVARVTLDFSGTGVTVASKDDAPQSRPATGGNTPAQPGGKAAAPAPPVPLEVGPASIAKQVTGEEMITALPKPITDVAVAGDGRFLVLSQAEFDGLVVYDADERKIAHTIRLPSRDFRFAAGGNTVLVYANDTSLLTTYDLVTGEKLKSKQSPVPGPITTLTMGRARGDRALLRHAKGNQALDRCQHLLLDVTTLSEIPWSAFTGGSNGLSTRNISFRDIVHQRADATMSHIAEWNAASSPSGLSVFWLGSDTITIKHDHTTEGSQQVGDDGRLYTANGGIFDRDLNRRGLIAGQRLFPGIGGILYLGLDDTGRFTVYQCGTSTPLVRWGTFPDWNSIRKSDRLGQFATSPFAFDKQIVFDPVRGRLLLIPASLDKIIQRPFDLKQTLTDSGVDYLVPTTRPHTTATIGKAWSYQVQAISNSDEITYTLESGPDGMQVTPAGKVAWTPQNPTSRRESVIITVKNKSGDECFHTFEVWVVSPSGK